MDRRLTTRGRLRRPLVLLFLVVVVNLPLAHSIYLGWRLDRAGVDTTATVVDTVDLGDGYGVELRLGRDVDPEQVEPDLLARVDEATYAVADRDDEIGVRVLPGRPSAYRVTGQVTSALPWVVTGFADLVLVVVGLLLWTGRRRGARRGVDPVELHLVALGDVERCRPGGSLEQLDEATYVVTGEVTHVDDVGVVLDVGTRVVRVDLAGFANPVGYQQPARVTARLSDWSP